MSDAPFFPQPATSKPESPGPYRAAESAPPALEEPTAGRTFSSSRPLPRTTDAAERTRRIEELVAARARSKRNALVQIGVGLAFAALGVALSVVSKGSFIWYGAVVTGVLWVLRGTVALVRALGSG